MMNNKIKSYFNKCIVFNLMLIGSAICTIDVSHAYSALYIDTAIDVEAKRLRVEEPKTFTGDNLGTGTVMEDEKWSSSEGLIYDKGGSGGRHKYYPDPKKVKVLNAEIKKDGWPAVDQENFGFRDYIRPRADEGKTVRRTTFPGYPMRKLDMKKSIAENDYLDISTDNTYLGKKYSRLYDSIKGVDENRNPGDKDVRVGLVGGVNLILDEIERLRGPFNGGMKEEFVPVLMEVGKLVSGQYDSGGGLDPADKEGKKKVGSGKIKILHPKQAVGKSSEKDKSESGSSENPNPDGKNIIIQVSERSVYKVKVSIGLEGGSLKSIGYIPHSLDTGFEYVGYKNFSDGKKSTMMYYYKVPVGVEKGKTRYEYYGMEPSKVNSSFSASQAMNLEVVTTYDVVAGALMNYANNVYASDKGKPTGIAGAVYTIFEMIIEAIESVVGISDPYEIIYNKGDRQMNNNIYSVGMYPIKWEEPIKIIYSLCMVVSVISVGFAVLRILMLTNLDAVNVGVRYSIKTETMNLIFVGFGMLLLIPVFKILATLNFMLVDTINAISGGMSSDEIMGYMVNGMGFAGIIQRFLFVGINGWINVLYIFRALNIALLVSMGPLFLMSVTFGRMDTFMEYCRELVGNIFLQTIHALLMMFIANVTMLTADAGLSGRSDIFMQIVLMYAIIPTTVMFKTILLGNTKTMMAAQNKAEKFGGVMKGLSALGVGTAIGTTAGVVTNGGGMLYKRATGGYGKISESVSSDTNTASMSSGVASAAGDMSRKMTDATSNSGIDPVSMSGHSDKEESSEWKKVINSDGFKNTMSMGKSARYSAQGTVGSLANGINKSIRGDSFGAMGAGLGMKRNVDTIMGGMDNMIDKHYRKKNEIDSNPKNIKGDETGASNTTSGNESNTSIMGQDIARKYIRNLEALESGDVNMHNNILEISEEGYQDFKDRMQSNRSAAPSIIQSVVYNIDSNSLESKDGYYSVPIDPRVMDKTSIQTNGKKGSEVKISNKK